MGCLPALAIGSFPAILPGSEGAHSMLGKLRRSPHVAFWVTLGDWYHPRLPCRNFLWGQGLSPIVTSLSRSWLGRKFKRVSSQVPEPS